MSDKTDKTKAVKASRVRIGGMFRPGTAVAVLYQALEDGKAHRWADLQKLVSKDVNFEARVQRIRQHLRTEALGHLLLDEEAGLVRLELNAKGKALTEEAKLAQAKIVKVEAASSAKPKAKPATKAKPKAKPATKPAADAVEEVKTA